MVNNALSCVKARSHLNRQCASHTPEGAKTHFMKLVKRHAAQLRELRALPVVSLPVEERLMPIPSPQNYRCFQMLSVHFYLVVQSQKIMSILLLR